MNANTPRRAAPIERPVALSIASSDSGGGAGIQADLKTMEACGAFGTSVLVATTAQNTRGVDSVHTLPPEEIDAQYRAVSGDFELGAVKTGMLATEEIVERVAGYASETARSATPWVVDPVMVAASGDRLLEPAGEAAYEALIAEAALVTPNAEEATVLTGIEIDDGESARRAGETLLDLGAEAALLTGGHVPGECVRDVLITAENVQEFEHPRIETEATHGSGCMLSSAIAAELARGASLAVAVENGLSLLRRAIRYPNDVGEGPGSVDHLAELRERAARVGAIEALNRVVERFVARDVSALVPEVGMNVVGASRYAERVPETAAVEGRITRTLSGVQPNRGVRPGASSHVARFLLAAREFDPALRFAVNCRFDSNVETALDSLSGPIAEFERGSEPEATKNEEGETMGWGARQAFEGVEGTPVAVIDRGEIGKEAIVKLLANDAETLETQTIAVLDALENQ